MEFRNYGHWNDWRRATLFKRKPSQGKDTINSLSANVLYISQVSVFPLAAAIAPGASNIIKNRLSEKNDFSERGLVLKGLN